MFHHKSIRDLRGITESERYDRLTSYLGEFLVSKWNPLVWQNKIRYPYFKKHIGDIKGKTVIDVGCGWGILCRSFAEEGAIVTGIDVSEKNIILAKWKSAEDELDIQYHHSSIEDFNPGIQYDIVVCTDALEHFDDHNIVVDKMASLLKPGGFFGFVTVADTFWARLLYIHLAENILRLMPRGMHEPKKFISPNHLTELLLANDVETRDIKGIFPNPILLNYIYIPYKGIEYIGYGIKKV